MTKRDIQTETKIRRLLALREARTALWPRLRSARREATRLLELSGMSRDDAIEATGYVCEYPEDFGFLDGLPVSAKALAQEASTWYAACSIQAEEIRARAADLLARRVALIALVGAEPVVGASACCGDL